MNPATDIPLHIAMHATWAIALGAESPVLTVPWHDEAGLVAYVDLRVSPERVDDIPEARENPPLAEALVRLNAVESPWATAKCDRWTLDQEDLETASLDLERDHGSAHAGIGSYIDFYHRAEAEFVSLEHHRELLRQLVQTAEEVSGGVRRDEPAAMLELTLRRCIVEGRDGYAITAFLYAIGEDEVRAQSNWAVALAALTHILLNTAHIQR